MNVLPLRFGSNLTNETDCQTEWTRVKRVYGSSPYTLALALRILTATLILIGIAIEVCDILYNHNIYGLTMMTAWRSNYTIILCAM